MEDEKRRKKRKRIAVIVLLVVAALVYGAVSDRQGNAVEVVRGEESADSTGRETEAGDRLQDGNEEQEDGEEKENAEIYVDVGGAVVHPGVVNIAEGSRVLKLFKQLEERLPKLKRNISIWLRNVQTDRNYTFPQLRKRKKRQKTANQQNSFPRIFQMAIRQEQNEKK